MLDKGVVLVEKRYEETWLLSVYCTDFIDIAVVLRYDSLYERRHHHLESVGTR
jgi:hypothetical protein